MFFSLASSHPQVGFNVSVSHIDLEKQMRVGTDTIERQPSPRIYVLLLIIVGVTVCRCHFYSGT